MKADSVLTGRVKGKKYDSPTLEAAAWDKTLMQSEQQDGGGPVSPVTNGGNAD